MLVHIKKSLPNQELLFFLCMIFKIKYMIKFILPASFAECPTVLIELVSNKIKLNAIVFDDS